jgi:3-isopropylmalate dehydratase small subunit
VRAHPGGCPLGFEIEPFRKQCLLNGLDDIEPDTAGTPTQIRAYEHAPPPTGALAVFTELREGS